MQAKINARRVCFDHRDLSKDIWISKELAAKLYKAGQLDLLLEHYDTPFAAYGWNEKTPPLTDEGRYI